MVDIISVTYGQNEILKCFINSIKSQTNQNWRLFIIHDGPNPSLKKELENQGYLDNIKVFFIEYKERTNTYGHILREWGLKNIVNSEYVLITNGDNYYTPNMIDEVLKRKEDFIYFDCVHSHKTPFNLNGASYGFMPTELRSSKIDMGCVVVKTEIAKKVGFNHTGFSADWDYFSDILKTNPTIFKIDKVLFVHN
jgi:hypothetical protein